MHYLLVYYVTLHLVFVVLFNVIMLNIIIYVLKFFSNKSNYTGMAHEEGASPELLDALVDKRHRSYKSAVCGISLGTFRARVPMSTMSIHRHWVPRYGLHLSHIFIVSVTVCSNLMFHFAIQATRFGSSPDCTTYGRRYGRPYTST